MTVWPNVRPSHSRNGVGGKCGGEYGDKYGGECGGNEVGLDVAGLVVMGRLAEVRHGKSRWRSSTNLLGGKPRRLRIFSISPPSSLAVSLIRNEAGEACWANTVGRINQQIAPPVTAACFKRRNDVFAIADAVQIQTHSTAPLAKDCSAAQNASSTRASLVGASLFPVSTINNLFKSIPASSSAGA
jgi:hypothetical protein